MQFLSLDTRFIVHVTYRSRQGGRVLSSGDIVYYDDMSLSETGLW